MISFRYHLVSLVAVFLALALGIVVGTTALNGPITTDLRKQVNTLRSDRTTLANQVKALQAQVDDSEQFAATYGAATGRRHAEEPERADRRRCPAPAPAAGLDRATDHRRRRHGLRPGPAHRRLHRPRRGARHHVAGHRAVAPDRADAARDQRRRQLGGALLAFVLLGKGQPTDLRQVLGGFSELHMLTGSSAVAPAKT